MKAGRPTPTRLSGSGPTLPPMAQPNRFRLMALVRRNQRPNTSNISTEFTFRPRSRTTSGKLAPVIRVRKVNTLPPAPHCPDRSRSIRSSSSRRTT